MPYVYGPGQVIYQPAPQPAGQLEQLRAAQYQQQVQAVPAQPQPSPGIIWVQGEEGAKAYMVAPGASVMLMDAEGSSFYIKSADASGMPMPLRIFDYVERQAARQAQPAPVQPAEQYATRQEIEELRGMIASVPSTDQAARDEIAELRKQLEELKKKEEKRNGKPAVQNP